MFRIVGFYYLYFRKKDVSFGSVSPMKEFYSYYYDAESEIMYKSYFGEITIKDIESSWEAAFNQKLIPKNTDKFILDYRKATMRVKSTEHSSIADFYKKHPNVFKDARIAVISGIPRNTVISILVHEKDEGYQSFPFNNLEDALKWIQG